MFSLFNGIYDSYLAPSQLNLLIVGPTESGKTTLLERIKVTEIPKKGSSNTRTVQQRIAADDPPESLKKALMETGATLGRSRHRSLSKTSLASGASTASKSAPPTTPTVKETPQTETSQGNAVVVTRKNRFRLFCPAPSRYAKASQEQDEEYVEPEQMDASVNFQDSFASLQVPPQRAPQRARTHSKELDVDMLDFSMSEGMDHSTIPKPEANQRETSMQSIGLNDEPKAPLHHVVGPAILQSSAEEYNVKTNAKMLPLRMIRPTSK